MHPTSNLALLVAAGLIVTLSACTTEQGEEGNYYFKYEHPGVWAFATDVAVGTRVDVSVWADEDTHVPVDVDSVELMPAEPFETIDIVGNIITLSAVDPGDVELTVSHDSVADHVDMTADDATALEWHFPDPFQVSGGEGDFVDGGTALIPIDLKNDDELLIGYGVTGVTADPAASAAIPDQVPFEDVYFLHVDIEAAVGVITLDHAAADPLALTAVGASAIAWLVWNDFGTTGVALDGIPTPLFLQAEQSGGRLVFGLLGLVTVTSTTPTTCSVAPSTLWGDGVYEVSGVAEGSCTVTATLGGLTALWTGDVQAGD